MKALNTYQKYLVEEFADDYLERKITRRDLLRRVLLITGGIPLSASVLTALGCGDDDDDETPEGSPAGTGTTAAAATTAATSTTVATATSAATTAGARDVQTSNIVFPGPESDLLGYITRPTGDAVVPGLLIIHENRGLTEHIVQVAQRYAQSGFAALSVDLCSRNGGSTGDTTANMGFLSSLDPEQVQADLQSYAAYLLEQDGIVPAGVGVIGFCLGGGYTWEAVLAVPEVLAAAPYYGPCRVIDQLGETTAAILAIYGATDERVTTQAEAVRAALEARGLPYEVQIYEGAGHAFFNDTGQNYNEEAADDAFARTVEWMQEYVSG